MKHSKALDLIGKTIVFKINHGENIVLYANSLRV
jgi:hypothetical protein